MVVQIQGSDAPEGSFAAKPKVMLRAGTKYCRVEEQPDPEHGIHGLMIVNEPDVWMVNLASNSAEHIVDGGPTFNCRMPVVFADLVSKLPEDQAKQISELEFGHELEYFKNHVANPRPGPISQGKQTVAYLLSFGDIKLALFTWGTPERPLSVYWAQGERRDIFWFPGYEEIPFDAPSFPSQRTSRLKNRSSSSVRPSQIKRLPAVEGGEAASMKKYKFKAAIESAKVGSGGACIYFPYEVEKEFGTRGRVPVKVTFDGAPYTGSLVKYGAPQHMLGILKGIREQIGKGPGDSVDIVLWKDEEIRTVEIPSAFKTLLKKESLLAGFEKLSYTHRKEYVRWIMEAKKEETRQSRMAKAVAMLRKGGKTPG